MQRAKGPHRVDPGAPRWGIFIPIDELGYPRPTLRDAVHFARSFNRDAAMRILPLFVLALSIARLRAVFDGDSAAWRDVQAHLVSQTISHRRLRELRDKLPLNTPFDARPIFHRAQLYTAIKLVAVYGDPVSGNRLESREDFDALVEFALLLNGLFRLPIPDLRARKIPQLAAALAPMVELENPPALTSLVRASETFGPLLDARMSHPIAKHLDQRVVFTMGVGIRGMLDLVMAIFAVFKTLPLDEFLRRQSLAYFNPLELESAFGPKLMGHFLPSLAMNVEQLPAICEAASDDPSYLLDLTAFRRKPFWQFTAGQVMCVDPIFLVERLSHGVFHAVATSLDGGAPSSRSDPNSDRMEFTRLWGLLFEDYIHKVMRSIYPEPQYIVSPRFPDDEEAFDAVIVAPPHAVLFQFKAGFVAVKARYSGQGTILLQAINDKIGFASGAALEQHVRAIGRAFAMRRREPVSGLDANTVTQLYPVVVTQDPILRFGAATRTLAECFELRMARRLLRLGVTVRAPVFMHVTDLETVAAFVASGRCSAVEILQYALQRGQPLDSFDQHLRRFASERRLDSTVLPWIEERFTELKDRGLALIQSGYYADAPPAV